MYLSLSHLDKATYCFPDIFSIGSLPAIVTILRGCGAGAGWHGRALSLPFRTGAAALDEDEDELPPPAGIILTLVFYASALSPRLEYKDT